MKKKKVQLKPQPKSNKYKAFDMVEIEPYGKYFRFSLDDYKSSTNDEQHYLPKECFPEALIKNDSLCAQLIIVCDDDLSAMYPFGKEAEELRQEFEKLQDDIECFIADMDIEDMDEETYISILQDELTKVSSKIREILDYKVDSRDSCFYLENNLDILKETRV